MGEIDREIIFSTLEESPPETMAGAFRILAKHQIIPNQLATQLAGAVGFRNIAVHNYDEIDYAVVYHISTANIGDFKEFTKAIVIYVEEYLSK